MMGDVERGDQAIALNFKRKFTTGVWLVSVMCVLVFGMLALLMHMNPEHDIFTHIAFVAAVLVLYIGFIRCDEVVQFTTEGFENFGECLTITVNSSRATRISVFGIIVLVLLTFFILAIFYMDVPSVRGNAVFKGFFIGTGVVSLCMLCLCGRQALDCFK